ncbi:hypothetical protein LINPERPRIM_LOCUS27595, partial [Linum perenne]
SPSPNLIELKQTPRLNSPQQQATHPITCHASMFCKPTTSCQGHPSCLSADTGHPIYYGLDSHSRRSSCQWSTSHHTKTPFWYRHVEL